MLIHSKTAINAISNENLGNKIYITAYHNFLVGFTFCFFPPGRMRTPFTNT